ncbi:dihydroneopterin aldolase [bacterium]|nr:dihydroneopterin aldolase [bacterium]
MDRVFIEGLSVAGRHGVMSHERKLEQEFVFDIRASFDASRSAVSDRLADTINYVDFRNIVQEVVASGPHYFIEKIPQLVIDRIFEDARILDAEVTIRKPSILPSGIPGITLRRTRV